MPQRAVEEQFKKSNPFISSLQHLWGYMVVATVIGVLVGIFLPSALMIMAMLGTLFMLPFYTGFTSLTKVSYSLIYLINSINMSSRISSFFLRCRDDSQSVGVLDVID